MLMHQSFDAIIVGGSFAGLSAAIYLGRARRSVAVLDTGAPRNRFASASHGFFAQDGADPKAMIATMRTQVAAYPTVTFVDQAATSAQRQKSGITVTLRDGNTLAARTVLLAHGITDTLPPLPGLANRWGHSVIHCPYCHGYEFSGQRLGVLNMSPMSVHQATLIPEWGPTTLFLNGAALDADTTAMLAGRGVEIQPSRVTSVVGEGTALSAIVLADGRECALDALFVSPPYRLASDLASQLGCEIDHGLLGPLVVADEMKCTTVEGVYAAGDITREGHTVTFACADGVMAALAIHRSLVFGNVAP
jgi:thioredoxin reductase